MPRPHFTQILFVMTLVLMGTALSTLGQVSRIKIDSGKAHLERARDYEASGDPRAEAEFRKAIAARKGVYPEAWEELSRYLAQTQRFGEAASAWRHYFKQSDRETRPANQKLAQNLLRAAELKTRKDTLSEAEALELIDFVEGFGSRRDAVPYAEVALAKYPRSSKIMVTLAKLIRWDQKQRSLELLNQAVALEPNNPSVYLTRGWNFYWNQGQPQQAEADFRKAIELSNGLNPSAWAGLGDSLAAQGRRDEALAAYRKYLAIRPESAAHYDREIRKAIERLGKNPDQTRN